MAWSDDPAHDWDVYCDMQERAYKALIHEKTCADCGKCDKSPDERTEYGYCREIWEYVLLDDSVEEIGCDTYEE